MCSLLQRADEWKIGDEEEKNKATRGPLSAQGIEEPRFVWLLASLVELEASMVK